MELLWSTLVGIFTTDVFFYCLLGVVAGMVIGVPILAVLYLLVSELVNKRLQKKGVKVATEGPQTAAPPEPEETPPPEELEKAPGEEKEETQEGEEP